MTNQTMGLSRLPELGPALSDNGEKAVGAAALATSSGAVLACSACCVLPLAIPAVALALSATTIAWIEAANVWITGFSVILLAGAWALIWRQSARSGKRAANSTIYMLCAATLLSAIAVSWPYTEESFIRFLS